MGSRRAGDEKVLESHNATLSCLACDDKQKVTGEQATMNYLLSSQTTTQSSKLKCRSPSRGRDAKIEIRDIPSRGRSRIFRIYSYIYSRSLIIIYNSFHPKSKRVVISEQQSRSPDSTTRSLFTKGLAWALSGGPGSAFGRPVTVAIMAEDRLGSIGVLVMYRAGLNWKKKHFQLDPTGPIHRAVE